MLSKTSLLPGARSVGHWRGRSRVSAAALDYERRTWPLQRGVRRNTRRVGFWACGPIIPVGTPTETGWVIATARPCADCGRPATSRLCRLCWRAMFSIYGQLCRHCNAKPVSRPRGLCWACYYTPAIRRMYEPVKTRNTAPPSKVGLEEPKRTPPPTTAQPGSPRKVHVLERRAKYGYMLHHPLDYQDKQSVMMRVRGFFHRRQ